ncbi:hypothetical protein UFOVP844_27 [uncultured Caudovirales phage]|uniref:Uncharacterized protein n=1 Tax=uncultured Caudovirales phage TaxID=2100421 RepID=A0A6J5P4L5_9CAUD|nr:hypothetical protein UFOVP844_27 [uncultured Caudovirales phage]
MRQCELERVEREKGSPILRRTGEKMVTFIDGLKEAKVGDFISLKKVKAWWVIDVIHDQEIESHDVKRTWSVGGL